MLNCIYQQVSNWQFAIWRWVGSVQWDFLELWKQLPAVVQNNIIRAAS